MPSPDGPNIAGTGATDSSIGTVDWGSPSRITADDGAYTSYGTFPGDVSYYLVGTNFGFSIPVDATIDGIECFVQRKASTAGRALDNAVRIVKGGTIGSTDKSNGSYWSNTDETITYGGASDLWGETWTYSDINASTFGFALSAKIENGAVNGEIDYFSITVHYTEAGGSVTLQQRSVPIGVMRGARRGIL